MDREYVLSANMTQAEIDRYLAEHGEEMLADEVFTELNTELQHEPLYDADILGLKIKDAIRELKRRRSYNNSSLTQAGIVKDLYEHFSTIKKAALTYYNRRGTEGELVHYENTVHRSYVYEDDLYEGVIPFVKVLF